METRTVIGKDEQGREYMAHGSSVYRVEGYTPSGYPLGTWVSMLTPFLSTGFRRYRVTLDQNALERITA